MFSYNLHRKRKTIELVPSKFYSIAFPIRNWIFDHFSMFELMLKNVWIDFDDFYQNVKLISNFRALNRQNHQVIFVSYQLVKIKLKISVFKKSFFISIKSLNLNLNLNFAEINVFGFPKLLPPSLKAPATNT